MVNIEFLKKLNKVLALEGSGEKIKYAPEVTQETIPDNAVRIGDSKGQKVQYDELKVGEGFKNARLSGLTDVDRAE